MSLTEDDLRGCATLLETEFCHFYSGLTGGTYVADLLLGEVLYKMLAAGVIEPGPAVSSGTEF